MLSHVQFEHYRGFEDFNIENLALINVLVGKNNAGKTSALEGIEVLARGCTTQALFASLYHRNEFTRASGRDIRTNRPRVELDICRLFHGFEMEAGSRFQISGSNGEPLRLLASIVEDETESGIQYLQLESEIADPERFPEPVFPNYRELALRIAINDSNEAAKFSLSPYGGIPRELLYRSTDGSPKQTVVSIPVEGLDAASIGQWWGDVVLTDAEDDITDALRLIEQKIERIAFVPDGNSSLSRETFKVRVSGIPAPIPLGTLGDGMKRMLAVACAVQRAANGSFFVDEIDTGLHHSTLNRLWHLLLGTAQARNVQVFATTHSLDCLRSLARLIDHNPEFAPFVAVYRIDKNEHRATRYNGTEVGVALESEMEIRG